MTKMMKFNALLAKKANLPKEKEKRSKEEEKIEELLAQFRNMILESEDELVNTWRFEDEFLVRFIRGRKYNLASAMEKLTNNVHVKRHGYPDVFKTLYPSALQKVLDTKIMSVLRHRDELGRHIVVFRPELFDPNGIPIDDLLRYQILIVWEMMSQKETQINGITVLLDGSKFNPKQIKVLTPHNIQKYVMLALKCSPTRFKGCHVLFLPQAFHLGMQFVVKPLLPEKVRNRIFSHGSNLEDFYKIFPQNILPKWLGGTLSDEDAIDTNLETNLMGKDAYYKDLIQ